MIVKHVTDSMSAISTASDAGVPERDKHVVPLFVPHKRSALLVLVAVSALVFAVASVEISMGIGTSSGRAPTGPVSLVATVWLATFLASTRVALGSPYLFATAYILPLFAFHFGLTVQDALGLVTMGGMDTEFGQWIIVAAWYATLAMSCIGIGFSVGGLVSGQSVSVPRKKAAQLANWNLRRLRNLGVGLAFASVLFVIIGFIQVGNIFSYDRFTLFFGGLDTRGIGLFSMVAPAAVTILLITAQTPASRRWGLALALCALLLFLFLGNRSTALFPLVVGLVLWVKTGHRIRPVVAVIVVVVALLVIPIVAALRTIGAYDTLTLEDLGAAAERSSVTGALAEMGGSGGVLAITLQYVPAEEPFRYGSTYLRSLKNVLPNIGFVQDRSEDPREILAGSGPVGDGLLKLSPARWASLRVLGVRATLLGHGVGFSGVAEPYFNFGYIGVVVFFAGLGFLFWRLDSVNVLLSFPTLFITSLLYWHLVVTVRNEFGNFTKPAAFTLIIVGIWVLVRRFTPFARA